MATVTSNPFFGFAGKFNSTNGWFAMPFPKYDTLAFNGGGGGFMGTVGNDVYFIPNGATSSYNPCSNSSYRMIWNNSNYQNNMNAVSSILNYVIPDLPNTTDNFILVFPTDLVNSNRYVKINKPEFIPADSACSTLTYITAFPVYEYEESSTGGGSTDITPLIPAILMIPATIIVVSFFSIIYKMFINRRTRS